MIKLKYVAPAIFILLLRGGLLAQTKDINVVTTAVPFLRIPSDARYSGMGATGIATLPAIDAVNVNVGRLSFLEETGAISANYSPWLRAWSGDMYLASLAGYKKVGEDQIIHSSIKYFNPGNLQFTDNRGNHLQSYRPHEFSAQVGYSRKISDRLGLGAAIKYIHSDLANGMLNGQSFKPGNAVAADLGFYYSLLNDAGNGWAFGAALTNLGSKISYTNSANEKAFIPANMGLGASFTRAFDEKNKLSVALDINKLLVPTAPLTGDSASLAAYNNKTIASSWFSSFGDAPGGLKEELREVQLSFGLEYWYNNQFALRGGYFCEDRTKGYRSFFSAGVGVIYNVFGFNFSYLVPAANGVNKNPLSNTLQFGMTFNFKK